MPTTSACWWSEERLRRLALHDEVLIESVLAMRLRWAAPDTEEILGTMIAVARSAGSPGWCRRRPISPSSSATTSTPHSRSSTEVF
jgi:hypothetical protein